MGTRFMCTRESPIHQLVKERIVANDERETELIFRTMRNTSRVAKNAISTKVVAMEKEGAKFEDVRELVAGARGKMVYATGDADEGIWSAGQVQGLIHDIPTCAELVSRIMRDAEAIMRGRFEAMMSAVAPGRRISAGMLRLPRLRGGEASHHATGWSFSQVSLARRSAPARKRESAEEENAHESLCLRRQRRRHHRRCKTLAERHAGAGQGPCLRPQPRRPRHDQGPCPWRGRRRRHRARHGMGRRSRRARPRRQGRQGRRQDHGLGRPGLCGIYAGRSRPAVPRALQHEFRGGGHPARRARHHAQRRRHQRRAAAGPVRADPGRELRRRPDGDADRQTQGRQARDRLLDRCRCAAAG